MTTLPLPPLGEVAASVPREQIPVLVTALMMRLLTEPPVVVVNDNGATTVPAAPDQTLTVREIAKALHRSERWIWRNKSRLPFLRRVGGRGLLASRRELDRWLAGQQLK
jgi:hypothetical protein